MKRKEVCPHGKTVWNLKYWGRFIVGPRLERIHLFCSPVNLAHYASPREDSWLEVEW